MKLGITSDYLARYGLEAGAARMRAHGYDCVDFQDFVHTQTEFFKRSERSFERELKSQRDALAAEGITVYQAHGPWRYPSMDGTKEDRDERFAAMSKAIRGTAYLGAKVTVVHPLMPFGAKSPERPEEMKAINLEFMSALTEVAREYGVTVCYENMPFPLLPIHSVRDVTDFAKRINSPHFKVCLDTGTASDAARSSLMPYATSVRICFTPCTCTTASSGTTGTGSPVRARETSRRSARR